MKLDAVRLAVVAFVALAYWGIASVMLRAPEPWDAPSYWAWYAGSLGLTALCGWTWRRRPWRWGLLIIFGQLPVILFQVGPAPLMLVGIAMMALEAIPACLLAIASSKVRDLWQRSVNQVG